MASDLLTDAAALLQRNTQSAERGRRTFRFSVPSVSSYPFQWLWDSCFHAIVWAQIDVERAKDELRPLFAAQRPDGMIPHVLFWNQAAVKRSKVWHYLESDVSLLDVLRGRAPLTTAQTQPPVLAQAVEAIVVQDTDAAAAAAFTREALPVLAGLYRFWALQRDPDGDGLPSTISQFETGLDFSPAYDALTGVKAGQPHSIFLASRRVQARHMRLRYRNELLLAGTDHVEDMLVISIYIDGLQALARLARRVDEGELAAWAERTAVRALAALLEQCWDPERGAFWNQAGDGRGGKRRLDEVLTIQSLLPLLVEGLPSEVSTRLLETLTDPALFGSRFPVPSVALNEPSYLPDSHLHGLRFIWRGPASMNTNYLLWQGLRRQGQAALAAELAASSQELVAGGGFNEFYDAQSGRPVGAAEFGWATLAAVMCEPKTPAPAQARAHLSMSEPDAPLSGYALQPRGR